MSMIYVLSMCLLVIAHVVEPTSLTSNTNLAPRDVTEDTDIADLGAGIQHRTDDVITSVTVTTVRPKRRRLGRRKSRRDRKRDRNERRKSRKDRKRDRKKSRQETQEQRRPTRSRSMRELERSGTQRGSMTYQTCLTWKPPEPKVSLDDEVRSLTVDYCNSSPRPDTYVCIQDTSGKDQTKRCTTNLMSACSSKFSNLTGQSYVVLIQAICENSETRRSPIHPSKQIHNFSGPTTEESTPHVQEETNNPTKEQLVRLESNGVTEIVLGVCLAVVAVALIIALSCRYICRKIKTRLSSRSSSCEVSQTSHHESSSHVTSTSGRNGTEMRYYGVGDSSDVGCLETSFTGEEQSARLLAPPPQNSSTSSSGNTLTDSLLRTPDSTPDRPMDSSEMVEGQQFGSCITVECEEGFGYEEEQFEGTCDQSVRRHSIHNPDTKHKPLSEYMKHSHGPGIVSPCGKNYTNPREQIPINTDFIFTKGISQQSLPKCRGDVHKK